MTHCIMAIETIIVQTDPLTIEAQIDECRANLLQWDASLNMSSQTKQLKSEIAFTNICF